MAVDPVPEPNRGKMPDGAIELPAPTAWPIILAFGFTLGFAGLLTSASVTILGVILTVAGSIGWFREIFPHERHEAVRVFADPAFVPSERKIVNRVAIASEQARVWLPIETYPISAGVKGGFAGSFAMAALACTYGVLKVGSIWYPINLLGAAIPMPALQFSSQQLTAFHASGFAAALLIHGLVSLLVGLLYGAMLPMFPRHPIVLGGLVAPALWSALIYSILGILNPLLESRINWYWFAASQVAFGIVAGLVVVRQSRVRTRENLPWAMRAGIEAPGMMRVRDSEKKRP
jgi:hypothetical protein